MARTYLLTVALILVAVPGAKAHRVTLQSESSGAWAPTETLRSAFLLRRTGADRSDGATDPHDRQARLVAHFDAVLSLLAANADASLEIALDRLERRRGESWSPDVRALWREALAARRLVNMRRLRLYQQRGLFPINEHRADRAVPVFVDNYDTACAVGHLMRESGWGDVVAEIEQSNNLVYVTDVRDGPLVDWILASGLTQEEAALIQPGYQPPWLDAEWRDLLPGGSIVRGGLRYDNFKVTGLPTFYLQLPITFPPEYSEITRLDGGAAALDYVHVDWGIEIDPVYDDWLYFRADYALPWNTSSLYQHWLLTFSYDVTAESPSGMIAGASLESNHQFNFNRINYLGPGGRIDVDTTIAAPDGSALAMLDLHSATDLTNVGGSLLLRGVDAATFAPTKKVHVTTKVVLDTYNSRFDSLVHSFNVVPEPIAGILAATTLSLILTASRRRTPQS